MQPILTDDFIRDYPATGKRYKQIGDGGCPGLYLVVSGQGIKTLAYIYTEAVDGKRKSRRVNIGRWPSMSLGHARAIAVEYHKVRLAGGKIKQPNDPEASSLEKNKIVFTRKCSTLDEAAQIWQRERWRAGMKSIETYYGHYLRHVSPHLGMLPIDQIKWKNVKEILEKLIDDGKAGMSSAVRSAMSQIFETALENDEVPFNIMVGHRPLTQRKARSRVMTDTELRKFWERTAPTGRDEITDVAHRALRFQLLTGQRIGECISLKKSFIDFEAGVINYLSDNMKNGRPHVLPITPAMLEIINASDGDIVFPGDTMAGTIQYRTVRTRLLNMKFGNLATHDLRRTVATRMASDVLKISDVTIQRILAHDLGGSTSFAKHYNWSTGIDSKRGALELWQEYLRIIVSKDFKALKTFQQKSHKII